MSNDPKAFHAIIFYTDTAGNQREQVSVAVALNVNDAAEALREAFPAYAPDCASIDGIAIDPVPSSIEDTLAALAAMGLEPQPDAPGGLTVPTVPASATVH